jgi:hypothetical protein
MSMNDVTTALDRQIRSKVFSNLRSETAAAQQYSNRQDESCVQLRNMIQLKQQVQRCSATAAAAVVCSSCVLVLAAVHVTSVPGRQHCC